MVNHIFLTIFKFEIFHKNTSFITIIYIAHLTWILITYTIYSTQLSKLSILVAASTIYKTYFINVVTANK